MRAMTYEFWVESYKGAIRLFLAKSTTKQPSAIVAGRDQSFGLWGSVVVLVGVLIRYRPQKLISEAGGIWDPTEQFAVGSRFTHPDQGVGYF